jgi:hypothetical protein
MREIVHKDAGLPVELTSSLPGRLVLLGTFAALAIFSSIPFFVRHPVSGIAGPIVHAAFVCLLLFVAMQYRQTMLARSRLLAAAAITLLGVANILLYPATRLGDHPSSAPDALSVPIGRLLAGLEPYGSRLFDGAPISPGPGWVALHGAFAALGLIPLIVPMWLGLATWLVCRSGGAATIFVALVMTPLAFLQMSFVGHDIFAISLAFVVVALAAFRMPERSHRLIAIAILAGTIATARLPLLVLPLIIGLGLAQQRGASVALRFTGIAVCTALSWHGLAALWCALAGDFYQPFHLFQRAEGGAGRWFTLLGAVLGIASGYWIVRKPGRNPSEWLFSMWLLQTALFLPIGIGELINLQHFDWANWEGKNYLAYPLPLLAAALVLRQREPAEPADNDPDTGTRASELRA